MKENEENLISEEEVAKLDLDESEEEDLQEEEVEIVGAGNEIELASVIESERT